MKLSRMEKCSSCDDWGVNFHHHHIDGRDISEAVAVLCPECHKWLHETAQQLINHTDPARLRLLARYMNAQLGPLPLSAWGPLFK